MKCHVVEKGIHVFTPTERAPVHILFTYMMSDIEVGDTSFTRTEMFDVRQMLHKLKHETHECTMAGWQHHDATTSACRCSILASQFLPDAGTDNVPFQ